MSRVATVSMEKRQIPLIEFDSVSCRLRIFVRIIKECSTIFYQSQIIASLTSPSQNNELSRDFTDHANRAVLDFKDCMKNVFSNINSNSLIGVETSSAVFPPTKLIAMELDLVLKTLLWTTGQSRSSLSTLVNLTSRCSVTGAHR